MGSHLPLDHCQGPLLPSLGITSMSSSSHPLRLARRVLLRLGKAKLAFGGFSRRMRAHLPFSKLLKHRKGAQLLGSLKKKKKITSAYLHKILSSSLQTSVCGSGRHDKDELSCSSLPSTQLLTTHRGMKTPPHPRLSLPELCKTEDWPGTAGRLPGHPELHNGLQFSTRT